MDNLIHIFDKLLENIYVIIIKNQTINISNESMANDNKNETEISEANKPDDNKEKLDINVINKKDINNGNKNEKFDENIENEIEEEEDYDEES